MARFRSNPGFEAELQAEPKFQKGMHGIATGVAQVIERGSHHIMPRHRNASIAVKREGGSIFVVNTDHGGHIDEWGSQNSPPYAPMRRGLRAAGLRVDERQR